jgi:hypothetical protein
LGYAEELIKHRHWYISHELLYFESPETRAETEITVWENLILIRADGPEDAYQKAMERGRSNEQPVRIDGVEGRCRFLGLRDLVIIYDELEDGAELEYKERQVKSSELSKMVRSKERFQAFNLNPEED